MRNILSFLVFAACLPAHAQQMYQEFLTPSFDGAPNTEFSSWDVFDAPNGGTPNYPDVLAPNGIRQTRSAAGFPATGYSSADPIAYWNVNNPTIAQTTNGAFIVSAGVAGNIYSFSTATQFVLKDATPYVANTVVFQFQTAGTLMDYSNVRLVYKVGNTEFSLAANDVIKEFKGSGSSFGGVENRSALQWDLSGLGITSYEIRFGAVEASMSFQRALLDTSATSAAVVPISRTWDAGAGATTNWSSAANWSANTAPAAGANVTFSAGSSANLDSARQVGELRFAAPGGFQINAAGGSKLTVNTGFVADGAAAYTVNANVVMGGLHYNTIGEGATVTLNGSLEAGQYSDGSAVVGGFVKDGTGTLNVNGNIGLMEGSVFVADGTLRLAGVNRYQGLTAIEGGTLVIANNAPLNAAGALGTNGTAIQVGATTASTNVIPAEARVMIDGAFTVGKNFSVVGGNDLASFGGRNTGAGATFGGSIALNAQKNAAVFAEAASDRVNFNGEISAGAAARTLTKTGAGTVVFGGTAKTYANATAVQAGTLEIAAASSTTGNGAWTVNAGARLRVNGSLGGTGALTINGGTLTGGGTVSKNVNLSSGRIAPGANVGSLTMVGAQTWSGGGGYEWQIASANGAAGTGSDLLAITGSLNVAASAGNRFTIYVSSVSLDGLSALLADFDAGSAAQWLLATASGGITGFTASDFLIDASAFGNAPNGQFSVSQNGNSLFLNYAPVPEPGTWALLVLAGAGLVFFRSRAIHR